MNLRHIVILISLVVRVHYLGHRILEFVPILGITIVHLLVVRGLLYLLQLAEPDIHRLRDILILKHLIGKGLVLLGRSCLVFKFKLRVRSELALIFERRIDQVIDLGALITSGVVQLRVLLLDLRLVGTSK